MRGKPTAVILGAGASYCYEDGERPLPLQREVVGQLAKIVSSSGVVTRGFVGPDGLSYSQKLARILGELYGLVGAEEPSGDGPTLWDRLRERNETLETVYAKVQEAVGPSNPEVLDDFAAILRSSVRGPVPTRDGTAVCRHHRAIAQALEPGDLVIDFNWDSLMADALFYWCPFWFPRTGFGPWELWGLAQQHPKMSPVGSLVHLLHLHGSVLLHELLQGDPRSDSAEQLLYVGPPGYTEGNALMAICGDSGPTQEPPSRESTPDEQRAAMLGYIFYGERWYKPLFIAPSYNKAEYVHPYHRDMRLSIHRQLPLIQRFVIAGYSVPPADAAHLSSIFVSSVMRPNAEVVVVDPSGDDEAYQARIKSLFPPGARFDFSRRDFKSFCAELRPRLDARMFAD